MHNRAQLAMLLSAAIVAVIQKQDFNNAPPYFHFGPYMFANVNYIWQIKQEIRLGIRQMYLAGYDIREAPYAWANSPSDLDRNPTVALRGLPDQFSIFWYAAYAFNYISQYYADVDYSKLKRGEKEYQQFLQELYKADPSLPRPAATMQPTPAATKMPTTSAAQAVPAPTVH